MNYSTVRSLLNNETNFSFIVSSMDGVVVNSIVDDCKLNSMSRAEVSDYVLDGIMYNECSEELITEIGVVFTTNDATFFVPYTSLEVVDLDCYLN